MAMKPRTATLRPAKGGKWDFTLRSANGKVLAFSNQGYEKKAEVKRILRKYFPDFVIVE